ncbi:carboxypeptidase regulatory-like domain-containing protein [Spirosoma lituiforme]
MKAFSNVLILLIGLTGLLSCNEDTFIDPVQLTTVRGRVLYSVNQQPIRNATVKLTPGNRVVATDSAGLFRFDSVIVGSYTVQASKTGYGTEVATVAAAAGTSPVVTILLTDDKTQNRPPTTPTLVAPAQNSTTQSTTLTLKWTATDPNRDSLTYTVLLYRSGAATPTASYTGLVADSLVISGLDYNTTYLWQVIAADGINTVNGPIWSFQTGLYPDYSYVFVRRMNGQFQIFGATADGAVNQLTRSGSNWRPIVSPNRQKIAFISNTDTELQLYLMNLDGSNRQQVTTVPIAGLSAADLSFCWSPDGTQLLYPSNDRLYAVRTDGTGLRVVSRTRTGRVWAGCDWTPQGNLIAARTTGTDLYDNELAVFSSDGSANRVVYTRRDARVGNPVFSVNGRQLLFSADSTNFQNEQGRQLDARLYLLDLSSTAVTDLSRAQSSTGGSTQSNKIAGTNDLEPRFSPTGGNIIFTNTDNTGLNQRTVYIADTDGRNRKVLLQQAEMPYWR